MKPDAHAPAVPEVPADEIEQPKVMCTFTEMVNPETLKLNPRNPNLHPQGQLNLIGKVIRAQGWRQAVTVSKRSGLVVRGHGRVLASLRAGFKLVPVDYQDYESEAMEIADMIADNKLASEAALNRDVIKDLLLELDTGAFDTDLTGFMQDEIESLMTAVVPEGVFAPGSDDEKKGDGTEVKQTSCPKCGFKFLIGRAASTKI